MTRTRIESTRPARSRLTRTAVIAVVGVLGLAACGGGGSSDQDKIAALIVAEAEREGFELDQACARDIAAKFSDEDAKKLVELGENDPLDSADLSPAGEQTAVSILSCVDPTEFADEFIAGIEQSGVNVDRECATEVLSRIDFSTFDPNNPPTDVINDILPCVQP